MKLKITDLKIKDQRVLMRVDFNVPLNPNGSIADDSRIRSALPSIQYVLEQGGALILMSHLGRPDGKKDPKASLAPCAKRLSELLHKPVLFASNCTGEDVEKMAKQLQNGSVLLLENLRFHIGEENPEKEPGFVDALARLGDLYVNDAFGTAHRAHASTTLITRFFPHKAAMGFLMEKEISHLTPLCHNPPKPFFALIGGAKVSTKAGVIKKLLERLDGLFIGGAMAFPFLKALKKSIGKSLCSDEDVRIANEVLLKAKELSVKIYLPNDSVAVDNGHKSVFSTGIPDGWAGMDIGPHTIRSWGIAFLDAKTIFWNGPLGVYEKPPYDQGTNQIAEILTHSKAKVIIGGGDSVAAIERMGLQKRFSHLSTGGGASLEFLELGHLPGIDALSDKRV